MGQPKLRPIDLLRRARGRADLVESAVRMHAACLDCNGYGGAPVHPEQPCPGCGFTYADSYGVEEVVANIKQERKRGTSDGDNEGSEGTNTKVG